MKNIINIYVISDSHFYHSAIIGYCDRPFNYCSEMNEKMIVRWNSVVRKEDIVIHLGDVVLSNMTKHLAEIMLKLNGRKILVKGNHDRKGVHFYLSHGFDFVCDNFVLGDTIFTHRPIPRKEFKKLPYKLNIHGHIHEKREYNKNHYKNVSVERINYTPVNLNKILNRFGLKIKKSRKCKKKRR